MRALLIFASSFCSVYGALAVISGKSLPDWFVLTVLGLLNALSWREVCRKENSR